MVSGAVAHPRLYKAGYFFSEEFIQDSSWNGFEHKRLYRNEGGNRFIEVGRAAGAAKMSDGRGSAYASFLNDGALDLVINNEDAAPTVLKNLVGTRHRWLMLKLIGTKSNRDAIGARVSVTVGSLRQIREVTAGSSYASQSMLPVHFGLGEAATVDTLEIRWPSGAVQTFRDVPGNRYLTVVEGKDALEPTRVVRPGAPRRP